MSKISKLKRKINNFLFDHYYLKRFLHEAFGVLCGALSAFIYAFGFCCFTNTVLATDNFHMVTGGCSGLSQILALILNMCGLNPSATVIQAIGYTCFNIPLVVFAFFKIGKRFSLQTVANVLFSSLFLILIPKTGIQNAVMNSPVFSYQNVIYDFSQTPVTQEVVRHSIIVMRVIFSGCCTGLATAIAFKGDISCGGVDVVTYYISMKKSTSVGKYSIMVNAGICTVYSILSIIHLRDFPTTLVSIFMSILYLFVTSFIIDSIHLRNKKVQIQIITSSKSMAEILISNFPHGATISTAKGAYSDTEREIIWMVVSSFESKNVVSLARKIDTHAFITITSLVQVYGNFFIRPIN